MASLEHSAIYALTTSIAAFTPKVFANLISDKLDGESFLPWQQLVLASIRGDNLEDHLDKDKVLVHFASKEDEVAGKKS